MSRDYSEKAAIASRLQRGIIESTLLRPVRQGPPLNQTPTVIPRYSGGIWPDSSQYLRVDRMAVSAADRLISGLQISLSRATSSQYISNFPGGSWIFGSYPKQLPRLSDGRRTVNASPSPTCGGLVGCTELPAPTAFRDEISTSSCNEWTFSAGEV